MSVELKELPNEPILVVLTHPPLRIEDGPIASQAVVVFKKKLGGHVWRVIDFSELDMTFSDAMLGMATEQGVEGGINDMDVSTIYIGSSEIVKFGVKAFQEQEQYGKTNVIGLFETVDEGIAFARADIKKHG